MSKQFIVLYIMVTLAVLISLLAPGPAGQQGELGETGLRGSRGDQGVTGDIGKAGGQGFRGKQGETGPTGKTMPGLPGPVGDPGIHGIFTTTEINTDRTKTAIVLCPSDSYLVHSGTRSMAGDVPEPPWIQFDPENSGPTMWWLGFVGTWVDTSDPPVDIPWQVQTFGLCLDNSFVGD